MVVKCLESMQVFIFLTKKCLLKSHHIINVFFEKINVEFELFYFEGELEIYAQCSNVDAILILIQVVIVDPTSEKCKYLMEWMNVFWTNEIPLRMGISFVVDDSDVVDGRFICNL